MADLGQRLNQVRNLLQPRSEVVLQTDWTPAEVLVALRRLTASESTLFSRSVKSVPFRGAIGDDGFELYVRAGEGAVVARGTFTASNGSTRITMRMGHRLISGYVYLAAVVLLLLWSVSALLDGEDILALVLFLFGCGVLVSARNDGIARSGELDLLVSRLEEELDASIVEDRG
jgi:hypothetical protein